MRILFQGDSIIDGGWIRNSDQNHLMGQSFPYLISAYLGVQAAEEQHEFLNRGVSGNTAADLCARWQDDALNLRPDLITILVGTNDVHRAAVSKELAFNELAPCMDLLLRETKRVLPETRFVLMEPFQLDCGNMDHEIYLRRGELLVNTREQLKELAKKYDAVYVPLQAAFDEAAAKTGPSYWIWDSVHPTPAGHGLVAKAWLEAMKGKIPGLK